MSDLAAEARRLLAALGASPRKSFGQNFMVAEGPLRQIAAALTVDSSVPVVEIGPGLGFLTRCLLARGYRVSAVEKDRRMAQSLQKRLGEFARLTVHEKDFLTAGPDEWGIAGEFAVAGNIPYNITSPILEWLIAHRSRVREAVLTIQKEVAERLVAKPGTKQWGSLTIFVRTFADIERIAVIPRGSFFPAPNVDSAAIHLRFLDRTREPLGEEAVYFSLVRRAFQKRRKTLLNALEGVIVGAHRDAPLRKSSLLEFFHVCSLDPRRRPETLTLSDWAALSRLLSSPGGA